MASNVNVKFVTALAIVLTGLFAGAAWLGYNAVTKSGEDHIRAGDQLAAEGDWKEASKRYGMAVSHDRTRVDWLKTYRDALLNTVPETGVEYDKAYRESYLGSLRQLAILQPYDAEPQRELLEALYRQGRLTSSRSASFWEGFKSTATESIDLLDPDLPETQQLRRYPGLAGIQLLQLLPETGQLREETVAHLEAAVEADPTDLESHLGLVRWSIMEWSNELRRGRDAAAEEHFNDAIAALEELKQDFPDEPRVLLTELSLRQSKTLRDHASRPATTRSEAFSGLEPLVDRVVDTTMNASVESLTPQVITQFRALLDLIRPEGVDELTLQLIQRVEEEGDGGVLLMFERAERLMAMDRHEDAIEVLQRIIDMENLPVSLEGLILRNMRPRAVYQQGIAWIRIHDRADDTALRRQAIANAKEKREELVDRVFGGESATEALMLDTEIALAENRYSVAVQRLHELDRLTSSGGSGNARVVRMLADALAGKGELGAAQAEYDRLLEMTPFDRNAIQAAVELDLQLRDDENALARLDAALEAFPNEERFKTLRSRILALRDGGAADVGSDPSFAAVVEASEILKSASPDYDRARRILRDAIEAAPDDHRLYQQLVQVEAQAGDSDVVQRTIDEAIDRFPNVEAFADMRTRLDILMSEDRVGAVVGTIEREDIPQIEKHLRKHQVYKRFDRAEEAAEELAMAVEINPDHPVVVEEQFLRALADSDIPKARNLAEKATRLNLDQANGLMFQARLALAQNDLETALTALEQASEVLPREARVWQLLGRVQIERGRTQEGVESLRKAFESRPQEASMAESYAAALNELQRPREALAVVRRAREFNPSDPELQRMWLSLEESVGDPGDALAQRRMRYNTDPDDFANTLALIRLLTSEGFHDEAADMIAAEKQDAEGDLLFDLVTLEARLLAAQGKIDAGRDLIVRHIDSLPDDEVDDGHYITLSRFLYDNNREDDALAALRQASTRGSDGSMNAERIRANFYFQAAGEASDDQTRRDLYQQALEPMKAILESNADSPDKTIALRYVETLLRLQRWDEAEGALDQYAADLASDVRVLLLRSQIASGRGDRLQALRLVNTAVENAPNDPRPFLQRAQLNFNEPGLFNDVMADLEQVVRLQPNSVQARQMRAQLYMRRDRPEDAIAELRDGVRAVKDSDVLRTALISELMSSGRYGEAVEVSADAAEHRPDRLRWLMTAGDIAVRWDNRERESRGRDAPTERLTRAREFFAKAYEEEVRVDTAQRFARSLLRSRNPEPDRAMEALESISEEIDELPELLILKARALKLLERDDEAIELATEILAKITRNDQLREWNLHMQEAIMPMPAETEALAELMEEHEPQDESVMPLYELSRLKLLAATAPGRHSELITRLREILPRTDDPSTLLETYRLLGSLLYGVGQYELAAEAFKSGLEYAPNDLELNNNLAYTLARHLDNAEEALAFAEKAGDLAPTSSYVQDTLGWVNYRLERFEAARVALRRAVENATNYQEEIPAKLHMAQVLERLGEPAEARSLARDVEYQLERRQESFRREYQDELDALLARLNPTE